MEIIRLNTVGYYFYCPDLQIENFDKHTNKQKLLGDCTICKRSILEPSYDTITNNANIIKESEITFGKCGHMYHSECINSWIKTNNSCPIDKVAWQTFRVADSSTKLVLNEDKFNKSENYKESNSFNSRLNNFYPKNYNKIIDPIKAMAKKGNNYPGEMENKFENKFENKLHNIQPLVQPVNQLPVQPGITVTNGQIYLTLPEITSTGATSVTIHDNAHDIANDIYYYNSDENDEDYEMEDD
jgi:hypothetical protein